MIRDIALVLLTLTCTVLGFENYDLRRVVEQIENGYIDLMQREIPTADGVKKPIGDLIKPGSMGIFALKGRTVVCGDLNVTVEPEKAQPAQP